MVDHTHNQSPERTTQPWGLHGLHGLDKIGQKVDPAVDHNLRIDHTRMEHRTLDAVGGYGIGRTKARNLRLAVEIRQSAGKYDNTEVTELDMSDENRTEDLHRVKEREGLGHQILHVARLWKASQDLL